MLCRQWRAAAAAGGAALHRRIAPSPRPILRLRLAHTPCRSGLFQGIDLFDLDAAGADEDDDDGASLDPSALLSDNLITGRYLRTIYTTSAQPIPYSSSVAVKRLKGKGRGLVAAAPIVAGELVLVSEPLAALEGQGPSGPQVADLVKHLRELKFSTQQHEVFSLLYTGQAHPPDLPTPDLKGLCPWNYPPSTALPSPLPLPPDDILGIVQHNAFGDAHADLVVATLRGEAPRSLLGIWPEAAMINHSCAPNAVHFVIAGHMLVRATQDIPAGEEITLNYLGRGALAPVGARQEELQGSYGFVCKCPRCRLEARLVEDFGPLLEAVAEALEELQPLVPGALLGLAGRGDEAGALGEEALAQVMEVLAQMEWQMAETRQLVGVGPLDWLWLQASAYDLYQLRALLLEHAAGLAHLPLPELPYPQQQGQQQEQAQEPDQEPASQHQAGRGQNHERQQQLQQEQEQQVAGNRPLQQQQQQQQEDRSRQRALQVAALKALAQCVELAGAAVPGSDLHALVACKFLKRVEDAHRRAGDMRVVAAQSMAFQAVKARYGALDAATLQLLVEQNADVARQLDELLPFA